MSQNLYRDPIITRIIELLNAEGPAELKGKYHHGDIIIAPNNQMPFCSVAIDNQAVNSADSMEDNNVVPLVLTVVQSATRDIENWDVSAASVKLYRMIAGRVTDRESPDLYNLLPDSMMGVLRKYAHADKKLFIAINDAPMTADFGIGMERRGAGMYSVEGTLRITCTLFTETPHRPNEPNYP